ncbi:hypothetical protein vseg_006161 [Gypsophila vaccaria]
MASTQEVASEVQTMLNGQLQNGTTATLNNHTVATMQLIKSHSWSGTFTQLPRTIASHGGVARFDQLKGIQGSKGGVMYTINPGVGAAQYAVVLSWDAPTDFTPTTSPNRLFGLCGPRNVIENITWDSIRTQLDRAGSSVVINDEVSKIAVHATIINNPTTKMANLLANFLLIP